MKRYRILYGLGPGDGVNAFKDWFAGRTTQTETSLTFSGQLFEFCKTNDIECLAISSHERADMIEDGIFRVENRPKQPIGDVSGLGFHIRQLRYAVSLLISALKFRAALVIIDSGTTHWFALALFRLFGMKVVSNFHNTCWPAGYPPQRIVDRIIRKLDGLFLNWVASASMGVSPECQRQAETLAGRPLRFFQFRPMYAEKYFEARRRPVYGERPFRIMFAGRVERNKGVFDILRMAGKIETMYPGAVVFEICGNGGAFDKMAEEISREGLENHVILHGKLTRPELIEVYNRCHLVIIPTTSEFNEAFAMVAAEAVLMGRPILSNPVVPATEVLRPATVLAKTGDVDDYARKVVELLSDSERYDELCAACESLRPIFLDMENGMGAALTRMMESIRPGWRGMIPKLQVGA